MTAFDLIMVPRRERRPGDPGWKPTEPYVPIPKTGRHGLARRWLAWHMARTGASPPEHYGRRSVVLSFESNTGRSGDAPRYYAVWTTEAYGRPADRYYEAPEELQRLEIPAHAFPFPRADLWHAARQAGQNAHDCHGEGMGWADSARRAEAKANAADPTGEIRAAHKEYANAQAALEEAEWAARQRSAAAWVAAGYPNDDQDYTPGAYAPDLASLGAARDAAYDAYRATVTRLRAPAPP